MTESIPGRITRVHRRGRIEPDFRIGRYVRFDRLYATYCGLILRMSSAGILVRLHDGSYAEAPWSCVWGVIA